MKNIYAIFTSHIYLNCLPTFIGIHLIGCVLFMGDRKQTVDEMITTWSRHVVILKRGWCVFQFYADICP